MIEMHKVFKHIDKFLELRMKEVNIPGMAVAITDREKLARVSTYGLANVAAQLPVTPGSLFEIASVGKSFTVTALLQLRDEGRLDLQAPVTEYLPWFQVQSEYPPITVHHLMGHTAGIVRGTELAPHGLYDSWALRETMTDVPPGQYWHYSSIGYKTLGFLLERLTGLTLKEIIQSRILDPLGMAKTHPVITFETRKQTAIGYCSLYDDRPEYSGHTLVPAVWSEHATGDGCQASTAEDMAIFLRMIMNKGIGPHRRLISEESFNLMAPLESFRGEEQYGYALVLYPVDGRIYLGHGGANAGFSSHVLADQEEGIGVVILTNKQGASEAVYNAATYILKVIYAANHNEEFPASPPIGDPYSISNAKDYAGIYRAENGELKIITEDDKLLLDYDGVKIPLEQRGRDTFFIRHSHFELFLLEFRRDGENVVEAFHGSDWYVNDRYTGPRYFDYPEEWKAYPGHYRTRNPELSNFRVVLRKSTLILLFPSGETEVLIPLGDGTFRIGDDFRSPETLSFHAVLEGRALRADYSDCPYYRTFTH